MLLKLGYFSSQTVGSQPGINFIGQATSVLSCGGVMTQCVPSFQLMIMVANYISELEGDKLKLRAQVKRLCAENNWLRESLTESQQLLQEVEVSLGKLKVDKEHLEFMQHQQEGTSRVSSHSHYHYTDSDLQVQELTNGKEGTWDCMYCANHVDPLPLPQYSLPLSICLQFPPPPVCIQPPLDTVRQRVASGCLENPTPLISEITSLVCMEYVYTHQRL